MAEVSQWGGWGFFSPICTAPRPFLSSYDNWYNPRPGVILLKPEPFTTGIPFGNHTLLDVTFQGQANTID